MYLQILHNAGIRLDNLQSLSGIVGSTGAQNCWEYGLLVKEFAHHIVVVLEKSPETDHLLGVIIGYFLVDQGANL